jgi:hypothetical protein
MSDSTSLWARRRIDPPQKAIDAGALKPRRHRREPAELPILDGSALLFRSSVLRRWVPVWCRFFAG